MTTYNTVNKNSTTFTAGTKLGGVLTDAGGAIGLLLTLTQSEVSGFTTYTAGTKNSTTYSTINKN